MEIKFKKPLLIFFIFLFLLESGIVFALEVKYPPMPGAEPPQVFLEKIEKGEIAKEKALPLFVKYFLSLALVISVSACLLILILGGFSYLVSTGNPAVMAEAIKRMSQAGIGLIVILSSYLILTVINPEISILHLPGLEKTPPSYVAKPIPEEKEFVYFQTSAGKIVEEVALNLEAHEKFEGTNNIDYLEGSKEYLASKKDDKEVIGIIEKAEKARDESEHLKNLCQELKDLTDECLCGKSSCEEHPCGGSGDCGGGCCCVATGCSQMNTCNKPCGCSITSLSPCNLAAACPERHCDLKAISKKIIEIEQSMAKLKIHQKEVFTAQLPLLSDYLKLKKLGMMISLPQEAADYGEFFKKRELVRETFGKDIRVETFSTWPDPLIETEGGAVFDPTSIYFDKKTYENKRVIKESSRVEPLLVQSNLSPEDLNKIMTENAQEVLSQYSTEDFLPSSEEMNSIVQEAVGQVSSETSQEISEALTNTLSEELTATIAAEAGGGAGAAAGISADLGNQIGSIIAKEMPAELNALFTAEISVDLPNILANLNIDGSLTLGDLLGDNLPSGTTLQNVDGLNIILSGNLTDIVPELDALLNLNLSDFIPESQLPANLLNATLADVLPSDITNLLYSNLENLLPSDIINFLNTDLKDFLPAQFRDNLNISVSNFLPSEINDILNLDLSSLLSNALPSEISGLLSTSLIDLIPDDLANILSMNIGELLPGDLMDLVYTTLGEFLGIDLDEFFPDFLLNLPENINLSWEDVDENGNTIIVTVNIIGLPNILDQLFPGLTSLISNVISEVAQIYNKINDLLDTSLADFIPPEILDLLNTNLANFLPAKITDALSLSLGEIILPEDIKNILTTNLKEILPENITDTLSLSLADALPENIQNLLNTSLMDELPPQASDILNSSVMDHLNDDVSGLLNTSLADKLNLPSTNLKEILLENLSKKNPELYKLLTTNLKNNIPPEQLAILEGNLAVNISPPGKNIFISKLKDELPPNLLSVSLETGELSNKIEKKIEEKLPAILNKELKNKLSSEQINQFSLNLAQRGIIQNKVAEVFSENLPVIVKAVNKKSSQMISKELSKKLAEDIGKRISDKTSEQISKKVSADLEKIVSPIMLKMLEQGLILNFPHDLRTLDELKDYE